MDKRLSNMSETESTTKPDSYFDANPNILSTWIGVHEFPDIRAIKRRLQSRPYYYRSLYAICIGYSQKE
jgi:nitroreductase